MATVIPAQDIGAQQPVGTARYPRPRLYIDGEWYEGTRGTTTPIINPATEETLCELKHASIADLDRALAAAQRGFEQWRHVPAIERSKILRRAADMMRERHEHIARDITLEQGKPLCESRPEALAAADMFDWYAEEARRAYGRIVPGRSEEVRQMVLLEPLGPIAVFTPWNVPSMAPSRKIAAILAAGCSAIVKACEETPAGCMALVRACEDAGLPRGVLNLVFGVPDEVSTYLIRSPIVRKFSFTGSVAVGRKLAHLAADGPKRCSIELGGHAPLIVFDDADIEVSASLSARAKFQNAGQICIAPSRFYVHEHIYDNFLKCFSEQAARIKVGNGLEKGVTMGPMANARRISMMEALVADALSRGARLKTGGRRLGKKGFFWPPTILTDVPDDARIMIEEPFGPIAPIVRFTHFDDVMRRANSLDYGLAAYAFTRSAKTIDAVSRSIESGLLGINSLALATPETPFGGIKESGYGFKGGEEGLREYLSVKFVSQAGV
ncbi:MAG TPA: NAD-dependent succinate-semialdehyde dehydrogenase [Casimicrobiaceae bacterium]|nr:NAD-dependent succinate-semialdehyde dehydrogenase [Casimicrobiaceae bacterium]